MRSERFPKAKLWTGQPAVYAHLKLDGHFVELSRPADPFIRDGWLDSSQGIPLKCGDRLAAYLEQRVLPGDQFYGELYVLGQRASQVKTALIADDPALRISFFASTMRADNACCEDVQSLIESRGLHCPELRRLQQGWSSEMLLKAAIGFGAEGWVLKDGNLLNWRKLKVERTLDAFVTGVIPGKGKHIGRIGSLVLAVISAKQETQEVCRCGGMTDEERDEMTEQQSRGLLKGRVCEVKYQHVDSSGRLRHPRFIRWRDGEKSASECLADQDEELTR